MWKQKLQNTALFLSVGSGKIVRHKLVIRHLQFQVANALLRQPLVDLGQGPLLIRLQQLIRLIQHLNVVRPAYASRRITKPSMASPIRISSLEPTPSHPLPSTLILLNPTLPSSHKRHTHQQPDEARVDQPFLQKIQHAARCPDNDVARALGELRRLSKVCSSHQQRVFQAWQAEMSLVDKTRRGGAVN